VTVDNSPSDDGGSVKPSASHSRLPNGRGIESTADGIVELCRSRFPNHYAGIKIGDDLKTVVVYRRPAPDLDKAVRERFPKSRVLFRDARYAERELNSIVLRLRDDIGYWRDRGIDIRGFGPANDGSGLEVNTSSTGDVASALQNHYGIAVKVRPAGNVILVPPWQGDLPTPS